MSQQRGRRLLAVLAIAFMAAGCGGGSEQLENVAATETPDMGTESPEMGSPEMESPGTASPGGVADVERVGRAAMEAVPDSTLIELDAEDDGKVWDVTVVTGDGEMRNMKIDAESAKVTSSPTPQEAGDEDKAKTKELVQTAKIDYVQAAEKMLGGMPGGRITMLLLDSADGGAVWKGEVTDEQNETRKMQVNAETGEVMSTPSGTPSPS